METFTSCKSKSEIIYIIGCKAKPYSFADTQSGEVKYWIKNSRIELTYPTFTGQPSFCGKIEETSNGTIIQGHWGPNHIYRRCLFIVPTFLFIASLMIIKILAMSISLAALFFLLELIMLYFIAPSVGTKETEFVSDFIQTNLL